MDIVEQGFFTSELDIMKLNIFDWNRLNGSWRNPADALRTISSWFVRNAGYTLAREDLTAFPERDDWPGWKHAGRHERLGRLYWNAFHASEMGMITFSDEPDFHGTLILGDGYESHFWGDVGKVSAQCFAMTQKCMRKGDLWISVLDERTQVIIEACSDIAAAVEKNLGITVPSR